MKLKMSLVLICLCVILLLDIYAQKGAVLTELNNPDSIKIGNGYLYVQEKTTVYIYDLEHITLVNQFGQEGEGPGEMKMNPQGAPLVVTPHNNQVYVSSLSKLSVFSKTGEFIRESSSNSMDVFFPFGKKFICFSPAPMEKNNRKLVMAFYLADEKLQIRPISIEVA
jgi:hypothetical protein